VTNNLGSPATVNFSVEEISWDKNSNLIPRASDPRFSLKGQVEVEREVLLGEGETLRIPFKVTLPSDFPPGTHAFILSASVSGQGQGVAKVNSSLGSLWLVKSELGAKEEGRLKSFRLSGLPFLFSRQPLSAYLSYENSGNVPLNPYGLVEVKNVFGQKVTAFNVSPWTVLSQSERLRELELNSLAWKGGIYKVTLYLNRGYQDIVDQSSFYFFYLPWPSFFGVFGLILVWLVLKFKAWKKV